MRRDWRGGCVGRHFSGFLYWEVMMDWCGVISIDMLDRSLTSSPAYQDVRLGTTSQKDVNLRRLVSALALHV
jgi:hypothetical protein